MDGIVALIDEVITNWEDETILDAVSTKVNTLMAHRPLFTF